MLFTKALLAALSAAVAQAVIITNIDFSGITVGKPFVITFADGVGPITIYLGTGVPANVIQGDSVGTSATGSGSISWTPTSGGSFALKIIDAGAGQSATNPNFSGFFNVAGPVIGSTTTGSAASTTVAPSSTTKAVVTTPVASVNTTTTLLLTSTVAPTNGTSTRTQSTGSSSGSGSSTTIPTQVPNSMASGFASPLAFVFLAVGALFTLN